MFLCYYFQSPFPKVNLWIGEKQTNKKASQLIATKAKSSSNRKIFNEEKKEIQKAIATVINDYNDKASPFIVLLYCI